MEELATEALRRGDIAFVLLGTVICVICWVRFENDWIPRPSSTVVKIGLTVLGAILVAAGLYGRFGQPSSEQADVVEQPKISHYTAFVSVSGEATACKAGRCRLEYLVFAAVNASPGQSVEVIDRIKTSGEIRNLQTIPRATILNPEQFDNNSTFVKFRIRPIEKSNSMDISGAVDILKSLGPQRGKIGLHVPTFTEKVALTVDFRRTKWRPTEAIEPKIEVPGQAGVLQTGNTPYTFKSWSDGALYTMRAEQLPKGASIILEW